MRRARKRHTFLCKDVLHEPRRVKSQIWIGPAGEVWRVDESFRAVENSGSNSRRRLRRLEMSQLRGLDRHDDAGRRRRHRLFVVPAEADRETSAELPVPTRADRNDAVTMQRTSAPRFGADAEPSKHIMMDADSVAPCRVARVGRIAGAHSHTADSNERIRRKAEKD